MSHKQTNNFEGRVGSDKINVSNLITDLRFKRKRYRIFNNLGQVRYGD